MIFNKTSNVLGLFKRNFSTFFKEIAFAINPFSPISVTFSGDTL